jgi:glycosyltransferase involved in cell wall biosynthesis
MKPIRLLFNANSMVLRTGSAHLPGIGRAALGLAKALDELSDPRLSIKLLTQTFRGHIPARFSHLRVVNLPWPIGRKFDWLKDHFPLLETLSPYDLLYEPSNYASVYCPEKCVVTIHDAMFFSYPEDFLGHKEARRLAPRFAQSARAIATPSLSSKADIVNYLGVPEEKVFVIPWGVDHSLFHAHDKAGARTRIERILGSNRPYFLAVSCDVGRKNTIAVLKAFKAALACRLDHDLVLLWGNPPATYLEEFRSEVASHRVTFLRHTDDETLADLYAGATATWFPSYYEGFGFPILESFSCGTPVVTCVNSSLTEVGGDAAIYVRPDAIADMTDLMRDFDQGGGTITASPDVCIKQASKFQWRDCAQAYSRLFNEVAV